MKALVLESNGNLVWREHELKVVPGWRHLTIAAAGICGSDLGRGFKSGAYHYPLVMGHEFSARDDEGRLYAVYPLLPCGTCSACRKGYIQLCEHYDYFGSRRDGAFAEELYAPEDHLLPVPDGVTAEEAAMTEPAAVAYHGTHGFDLAKGARALVIGGGPIGLLAAEWLRIRGAGEVSVADIDREKLDFATRLGFTAIDSRDLSSLKDACDVVIEACGLGVTRDAAVMCTARKGILSFIGNPADDWLVMKPLFSSILRKELVLRSNWNSLPDPDWKEVLAHAGRDLDLKSLITTRVSLKDAPQAFERILKHEGFHCKTLIFPNGD